MLAPQTRLPTNVQPNGPSHTSCETNGSRRARSSVRVRHTESQMEETNVERKVALRITEIIVASVFGRRRRLRGRVRRIGRKCTCG